MIHYNDSDLEAIKILDSFLLPAVSLIRVPDYFASAGDRLWHGKRRIYYARK